MIALRDAALSYGERTVWRGLDLDVAEGEFLVVVGPNGSGKTSLLQVLLGLQRLSSGTVTVDGRRPRRGGDLVGYVPQHRSVPPHTPLRARDLVRLGVDGHRWGPWRPRRETRRRVEDVLRDVGAAPFADVPLHVLSGGELQRVRVAQALASDPRVLLCDEPLSSLDDEHQRIVSGLADRRRREHGTAVVFVTHEAGPVLPFADRVLDMGEVRPAAAPAPRAGSPAPHRETA
ncbi:metal ABC transporter ATP-binding protein [Actinomadura madurae]|uniref:metal ABC transporter ATP-binding protein n=1 Tax=Actinomadura madurae TaxID=1993 RepID=UPI00202627DF|nr:ATP-binding cassette domain-containing protein [Actinomadura madurae]MCP9948548.1 ATP-binding cassette domain-containing protein [Actinomadura madurae]MCP9965327.1 ATP-binding cassette domain-containing protein [Actinomadura madurae]MCP9977815.1 ATP-binding cassette domain-containing protein [Actinomadura madurae]MCQ0010689.1 ATP-binding cassette domain-containing protein [Actinomadura madurae]URM94198.1 ATP-binding cassette domain-containing protein [Actinomadura madurae]